MFSGEEIKEIMISLLEDTNKATEDKIIIRKVENILNFLREKEIREEIERKWEEIEKRKSESFISDVHEYTENLGSISIFSVKKTQNGIEISFSGIAVGLTEFGTELTYDVTGILPIDNSGKLERIKWLKRGLIDTKMSEVSEFSDE